jgi:hypothetical protein
MICFHDFMLSLKLLQFIEQWIIWHDIELTQQFIYVPHIIYWLRFLLFFDINIDLIILQMSYSANHLSTNMGRTWIATEMCIHLVIPYIIKWNSTTNCGCIYQNIVFQSILCIFEYVSFVWLMQFSMDRFDRIFALYIVHFDPVQNHLL